jgi:hypothetical protein
MASSDGTRKDDIIDVVFLYDKNSGEVRHTHYNGVVQGNEDTATPSKDLIEEEALKIAKKKGLDTSELAALHVAYKDLKHNFGTEYRVDIRTKTLKEQKFNLGSRQKPE